MHFSKLTTWNLKFKFRYENVTATMLATAMTTIALLRHRHNLRTAYIWMDGRADGQLWIQTPKSNRFSFSFQFRFHGECKYLWTNKRYLDNLLQPFIFVVAVPRRLLLFLVFLILLSKVLVGLFGLFMGWQTRRKTPCFVTISPSSELVNNKGTLY